MADKPSWIATVSAFQEYWMMDLGKDYEATLAGLLSRSWPKIQVALNTSGQGDCALGVGSKELLQELHIIITMVMLNIAGVRLSVEQRELYNDMITTQLNQIASGGIQVCSGRTAKTIPASGRITYFGK